jgi:hypothetical protein
MAPPEMARIDWRWLASRLDLSHICGQPDAAGSYNTSLSPVSRSERDIWFNVSTNGEGVIVKIIATILLAFGLAVSGSVLAAGSSSSSSSSSNSNLSAPPAAPAGANNVKAAGGQGCYAKVPYGGDVNKFCTVGMPHHCWVAIDGKSGTWTKVCKWLNKKWIPTYVYICRCGGVPSQHNSTGALTPYTPGMFAPIGAKIVAAPQ